MGAAAAGWVVERWTIIGDMERRSFLRGIFGGVTAAGLIVKATPADVEAFAAPLQPKEPLLIGPPPLSILDVGECLYNAEGEQVAIVTGISVSVDRDTVHSYGSGLPISITRGIDIDIRAIGIGHVEWIDGNGPKLRGTMRRGGERIRATSR